MLSFEPFPQLTTERLLLRAPQVEDALAVLYLRSDPTINQYVQRSKPKDLIDAINFLANIKQGWQEANHIYWAIQLKDNPDMIGSICLWHFSDLGDQAEVGYDLSVAYQGQGIMKEALEVVINFGFITLKLTSILAFTHRANQASKRLLERQGFVHLPDRTDPHNEDNIIYQLISG